MLIILSSVLLWNSCKELIAETAINKNTSSILETINLNKVLGLRLPDGSQITESDNSLHFLLPNGFTFVGTTTNNEIISSVQGTVKCECNSGDGGCGPFETKSQVGCASDKKNLCKKCTMNTSTTKSDISYDLTNYFIKIDNDESLPLLGEGLIPINSLEQWNQLEWVTHDIIVQYNDIINGVLEFVNKGYDEKNDIKVLVGVSIEERKMLLEIPYKALEAGMMYTSNSVDGAGGKCSGCGGDCKYDTAKFGQIRFCSGCDSGCTLSW